MTVAGIYVETALSASKTSKPPDSVSLNSHIEASGSYNDDEWMQRLYSECR